MHYPFNPTVAPGAPRPDLARLLRRHVLRAMEADWHYAQQTATNTYRSLLRQSAVGNFFDVGTDVRLERSPKERAEAADWARGILECHRRMAHRAWVRSVEHGESKRAACRAWLCARRYCGLPT